MTRGVATATIICPGFGQESGKGVKVTLILTVFGEGLFTPSRVKSSITQKMHLDTLIQTGFREDCGDDYQFKICQVHTTGCPLCWVWFFTVISLVLM